jgi:hypothetical protein
MHPDLKNCLRDPIPEIFDAARHVDAAVSAHLTEDRKTADELIRLADMAAIREWTESLWGKGGPSLPKHILFSRVFNHSLPQLNETQPKH